MTRELRPLKKGFTAPRPVAARDPGDGCCTPFPDARFINGSLVSVHMHHSGPRCAGVMEPLNVRAWLAEAGIR